MSNKPLSEYAAEDLQLTRAIQDASDVLQELQELRAAPDTSLLADIEAQEPAAYLREDGYHDAADIIDRLQAENARLTSEVARLRDDADKFGRRVGILCVEALQEHWYEVRDMVQALKITFPDGSPFAALDKL